MLHICSTMDSMVTRIRQLLDWQQLSPTQFADFIGVGRPVMSHILSERNKPSLEVFQRIVEAFPAVSMAWLLNGTGEMLLAASSGPAAAPPAVAPPDIAAPTTPASVAASALATHTTASSAAVNPPASGSRRVRVAPGPTPARFVRPGASQPAVAPLAAVPEVAALPPPPTEAAPTSMPAAAAVPQKAASELVSPIADASWLAPLAGPGKAIRRIVIFYRDGSFADYQPEG